MGESAFWDRFGNRVLLYDDVREHALAKHPEFRPWLNRIERVLADPEEVRVSSSDPRVVLYYQLDPEVYGGKWLVVVVKRLEQHFVSTFYITNQVKAGDVLWRR